MRRGSIGLLVLIAALSGCARTAPRFSLENARAHVDMLAGTIGSRPIGTAENARARDYVVDQLRLYGFDVRVQETDAQRPEIGRTAHVFNVIGVKPGTERGALALVAHYDSAPESPGGADDGLGVAVALEAARVLGARDSRRHALYVLLTDGEEAGLMGAAGLTADRDVMDRLQAYINIEAIGSGGTALLFETGPGNGWIVQPWMRSAPHPRGGSYAVEVYRRLPNDTDFSIFERHGIPGLNFAATGDSYPYHTARDTADRLSDWTLRATGENTVGTALALDAMDLTRRTTASETFFDVGQTVAAGWGPVLAWIIAAAALVCGLLGWFKTLGASLRLIGTGKWLLEAAWSLAGAVLVVAAMVGVTWLLRWSRTVYHPWYAHPDRLFLLLVCAGALAGWIVTRAGALLPDKARGERHPVLAWSVALPLWVAMAGFMAAVAPSAAYLWTVPLLVAGVGLLVAPVAHASAVRSVSILVLAVAGTLWLRDTAELLRFMVALFGRLPLITPIWVYAALTAACGLMVVPPLIAATAASRPLIRPSLITAALLAATAATGGIAYAAQAYTPDAPQRRFARAIVDGAAPVAIYEVAAQEPGLDLELSAPPGWSRATDPPRTALPLGRYSLPFVWRTTAPSPGAAPAALGGFTLAPSAAGLDVSLTITPRATGLTAVIVLPEGVQPTHSNLPGAMVRGRWQASFVAVPPEGLAWRASFRADAQAKLTATRVLIVSHRFPGGEGWQALPAWLPQEHTVWGADVVWILAPS